jgi:hypothetical protein
LVENPVVENPVVENPVVVRVAALALLVENPVMELRPRLLRLRHLLKPARTAQLFL